jgi:hypothetical protein
MPAGPGRNRPRCSPSKLSHRSSRRLLARERNRPAAAHRSGRARCQRLHLPPVKLVLSAAAASLLLLRSSAAGWPPPQCPRSAGRPHQPQRGAGEAHLGSPRAQAKRGRPEEAGGQAGLHGSGTSNRTAGPPTAGLSSPKRGVGPPPTPQRRLPPPSSRRPEPPHAPIRALKRTRTRSCLCPTKLQRPSRGRPTVYVKPPVDDPLTALPCLIKEPCLAMPASRPRISTCARMPQPFACPLYTAALVAAPQQESWPPKPPPTHRPHRTTACILRQQRLGPLTPQNTRHTRPHLLLPTRTTTLSNSSHHTLHSLQVLHPPTVYARRPALSDAACICPSSARITPTTACAAASPATAASAPSSAAARPAATCE